MTVNDDTMSTTAKVLSIRSRRAGGAAQLQSTCLAGMHEALAFIPSTGVAGEIEYFFKNKRRR